MRITAYIFFNKIRSPDDPRIDEKLREVSVKFQQFGKEIGATCWLNDCDILTEDESQYIIF